jgi:rhodanese-related sulfurtransferase
MNKCINIDPKKTQALLAAGNAVLVDIRGANEYAREHIAGAHCLPLSAISGAFLSSYPKDAPIIFHCQSGNRTKQAENKFLSLGFDNVYILEGGMNAWKKYGNTTATNKNEPLPLMRQVQIIVGFMVVLGIFLSYAVSPYFNFLSAFFGAGLLFAGISGFCGLANVLMLLPYNRDR